MSEGFLFEEYDNFLINKAAAVTAGGFLVESNKLKF
jgi:hypothetical protein